MKLSRVPTILTAAATTLLAGVVVFVFVQQRADTPSDLPEATPQVDGRAAGLTPGDDLNTQTATSGDDAVLPSSFRLSEPIQAEIAHLDPSLDGWTTEAFHDRAKVQLKHFAELISQLATGSVVTTDGLAHPQFRCRPLRPASLDTVFDDSAVRVMRWKDDSSKEEPQAQTANLDLVAACAQLLAPWQGTDSPVEVHFKIIGVQLQPTSASTRVHVQLSGSTTHGLTQQTATWTCRWNAAGEDEPTLANITVDEFEEVRTTKRSSLLTDCTAAVLGNNDAFQQQHALGIDHWRDTLDWRLGLDVAGPHGLAVGDVNGDGLDDLFVCEPGGLPNRLYIQQPDGTARDASAAAGINWLEPATSALLIDQDNDGDQDLVFASGRYLIGCENDGNARFTIRGVVTMQGLARSLSAVDFDQDGDLDIYVCCYISRAVALDDVGMGKPMPYHDANNGPPNYLYAYTEAWNYQDVTEEVGLSKNNQRFSYAAAWEDYDNDGDQDLYVANDFGRNNLYQNTDGRFEDVAAKAGVEDIATGMSVSWADYNGDGLLDLYVGNMSSSAGNRVMYQRRFQAGTDETTRNTFRRLARGNSLFLNTGRGTFEDVSLASGTTLGRWAWSSNFVDLNNDGLEDLVVANGMITSQDDPDDL